MPNYPQLFKNMSPAEMSAIINGDNNCSFKFRGNDLSGADILRRPFDISCPIVSQETKKNRDGGHRGLILTIILNPFFFLFEI